MNTEERQLAETLHRVTPEPPRRVTVEQVARRLASEPGLTRAARPRCRFSRGWAPAAAAAAVIVIAGASAGLATLASSHSNSPPSTGGAPSSSALSSGAVSSQPRSSATRLAPGTRIAGGPWGAELIDHPTLEQGSLVSAGGWLYAYGTGVLERIDPATGVAAATVPYSPPLPSPPVVAGNTVWVVSSYSGGDVVLHGYDAQTLAQTSSVLVPGSGRLAGSASNVLSSGPDGHLYVAAGGTVAVVDPADGQLIRRINLTAGPASTVAVSPDGNTLYVGVAPSTSSSPGPFELLVYGLSSGTETGSSAWSGTGTGGGLVATSGGVWGTTGAGMSEWAWFAPTGDLTRAVRIGAGAGSGLDPVPSYSGGVVWAGGSHTLTCASPANGQVLATATLPADHGVAEYFGSPVVAGGHAYSYYTDDASGLSGLVRMTPPAACTGGVSS